MINTQNNEKPTNIVQQPAAVWQDEVLRDLPVSEELAEQTKGGPGTVHRSGGTYYTGSVTVSEDG